MTTIQSKENEIKFIDFLNKTKNMNLVRNEDRFNIFDAEDKKAKIVLEIKFRNINYTRFKTTIIGKNKINEYKTKLLKEGYKYLIGVAWEDRWGVYNYKVEDEIKFNYTTLQPNEKYIKDYVNFPISLFEIIKEEKKHYYEPTFPKGVCLL